MSIWSKLFGESGKGEKEETSHQLPSTMVAEEFGEVNVRVKGGTCEVLFTILMTPQGKDAEGWQTGVAIDASGSMQGVFGRGLQPGPKGDPPQSLIDEYLRKGLLQRVQQGGQHFLIPTYECEKDLVSRGHRVWSKNDVEPQARKFTSYLADNLDADGGTTVIYWACGDGKQLEEIGDLTADQCETATFKGPSKYSFGQSTVLTPALRYFADRFKDAKNGMYVFITDGELHDLEDVKQYTTKLCKDIEAKRRNPLKAVLIGLGDAINEDQMEQLDDLDSGTDVDIWDHKIAKDMRSIIEIFAELVSENQIIAPTARILDASGNMVKNFSDGLPAKVNFTMPASSPHFVLEVAGKQIKQSVQIPTR